MNHHHIRAATARSWLTRPGRFGFRQAVDCGATGVGSGMRTTRRSWPYDQHVKEAGQTDPQAVATQEEACAGMGWSASCRGSSRAFVDSEAMNQLMRSCRES